MNIEQCRDKPQGKLPSTFTPDVIQSAMEMNPSPWLMANAGEDGLTAEFSFPGCMPPTALLTADNKAKHPYMGSGLSLLLRLPLKLRGVNVAWLASKLNAAELGMPTRCHFMGSWCLDTEGNLDLAVQGVMLAGTSVPVDVMKQQANETLTYCSFVPSAAYNASILGNLIYTMAQRASWANEYLASLKGIRDLFGPRDEPGHQVQTDEHISVLRRVLAGIGRGLKKKPN
jgi:hypothetical protein